MNNLIFDEDLLKLCERCEDRLSLLFKKQDELCFRNTLKVLNAFHEEKISSEHFNGTNGYGYNDIGREKIDKVFSLVLGAEDALVRSQFVSGTHALTVALFGMLRPGEEMVCITGEPYDTLRKVIGIDDNPSSLKVFGIGYNEVSLVDNGFDIEGIKKVLGNPKVKLVHIQRSKGYSNRASINIDMLSNVIKEIRKVRSDVIIMVDNCYCEFVEEKTPLEVGADIIVGSLIKNLGAGVVPNGGYIAGKKDLVELCAERLAIPGEGKEIGATLDVNRKILEGLYLAPSVVNASLKTAMLVSLMMEEIGYKVSPKYDEKRADIVQSIIFNDPNKMVKYCRGIQMASPVDSYAMPVASDMPGYNDKVIMAAGSFVQGSTIELSCDGPLRSPYIAYQQGALTYHYGKIGVLKAISEITK